MSSSKPSSTVITPSHPIPSLQPAFAESLSPADAPQITHPLTQLVSQLSFGIHLLSSLNLPRSQIPKTISIMQSHVTTMDRFLQQTEKSLLRHIKTIRQRTSNLSLPLSTPELKTVFDAMLCTHTFRMQLLSSIEIIDGVIDSTVLDLRTVAADIGVALRDVEILSAYARDIGRNEDVMIFPETIGVADQEPLFAGDEARHSVYKALLVNIDAWRRCLLGLQAKAARLASEVSSLKSVVREVEERVGWAGWRVRNQVLHSELHSRNTLTSHSAKPTLRLDTNFSTATSSGSKSRSLKKDSSQNVGSGKNNSKINSATQDKPLPCIPSLTPILFTLVPAPSPEPMEPAPGLSHSPTPTADSMSDDEAFLARTPRTPGNAPRISTGIRKNSFGSELSWEEEMRQAREGKMQQVGVGVWVEEGKKRGKGKGKRGIGRGWSLRGVFGH